MLDVLSEGWSWYFSQQPTEKPIYVLCHIIFPFLLAFIIARASVVPLVWIFLKPDSGDKNAVAALLASLSFLIVDVFVHDLFAAEHSSVWKGSVLYVLPIVAGGLLFSLPLLIFVVPVFIGYLISFCAKTNAPWSIVVYASVLIGLFVEYLFLLDAYFPGS